MSRGLAAVLFSDLKGFSAIYDDVLHDKIKKFNDDFKTRHIDPYGSVFHCKTWGDAFVICSSDPHDLAEIALSLRDSVKNYNWKRNQFPADIQIRIGLHATTINTYNDNEVSGKGMTLCARVEPVSNPNSIFCTEQFWQLLKIETDLKMQAIPQGEMALAKDFGACQLYELLRSDERAADPPLADRVTAELPRIKKSYTDKDKNDFIKNGFCGIRHYFESALQQTKDSDSAIEFELDEITSQKFHVRLYSNGDEIKKAKLWLGNNMSRSLNIGYSSDLSDNDSSYNEIVHVEVEENQLVYKPTMFQPYAYGHDMTDDYKTIPTPEKLGEFFWKFFIR